MDGSSILLDLCSAKTSWKSRGQGSLDTRTCTILWALRGMMDEKTSDPISKCNMIQLQFTNCYYFPRFIFFDEYQQELDQGVKIVQLFMSV